MVQRGDAQADSDTLHGHCSTSGALHESYAHMRYIWFTRKRGRLAHTRPTPLSTLHRRPCRYPLMPERAPLALWATPAHASLMASTTTDGVLAVYDDGAGLREQTLKVSATSQEVMGYGSGLKGTLTGMW